VGKSTRRFTTRENQKIKSRESENQEAGGSGGRSKHHHLSKKKLGNYGTKTKSLETSYDITGSTGRGKGPDGLEKGGA